MNPLQKFWPMLAFGCVLALAPAFARAQCTPQWQPFDPSTTSTPGLRGATQSVLWDPDGPGPLSPKLVLFGSFTGVGDLPLSYIALFDIVTRQWASLGAGVNGTVNSVVVLPDGDLAVAGTFTTAGGDSANRIARWDGAAWSTLGTGMNNTVSDLAVLPNGDLIAAGGFTAVGTIAANYIARWDGSWWWPFTSGMNSPVSSLLVLPDGSLVAGGFFNAAGGVPVNNIARWSGTASGRLISVRLLPRRPS
jgi:hypothetical protein